MTGCAVAALARQPRSESMPRVARGSQGQHAAARGIVVGDSPWHDALRPVGRVLADRGSVRAGRGSDSRRRDGSVSGVSRASSWGRAACLGATRRVHGGRRDVPNGLPRARSGARGCCAAVRLLRSNPSVAQWHVVPPIAVRADAEEASARATRAREASSVTAHVFRRRTARARHLSAR